MNRAMMLQQLATTGEWDIVVIGGGATGLGAAVDAASRGCRVLLVERADFSKGTSSRSTKLVHGGVRYLQQGNISLVRESLRERALLLKNAPHITSVQPFIVPVYSFWQKWYYAIGLRLYDLLSGKFSIGKTQLLSKQETIEKLPSVDPQKLYGGILYYDGQFDDSRMCTDLAATAARQGACILNYCSATGFEKEDGKIRKVRLKDELSGDEIIVSTRSVINATGVFTDAILQMDDAHVHKMVSPSQGIHLVIPSALFPGANAMMIPKTDDGRVLFAVPWHGQVVLGTTDTPVRETSLEPGALESEIDFILKHINRYGKHTVLRSDVRSVFAGLRPLVTAKNARSTAALARDHALVVSASGLITVTGGKWTTYRKMAEDAVDMAVKTPGISAGPCITPGLRIGAPEQRVAEIAKLVEADASLAEKLVEGYPYTKADIVYALRFEMAQTLEDLLARRTRLLFLDAWLSINVATLIVQLAALELDKDESWQQEELQAYKTLAQHYLLS